ncbi:MAG: Na/Pi cotransporter family protein [Bacillota bacterium]|jgi:phosphate:Na+ symporter
MRLFLLSLTLGLGCFYFGLTIMRHGLQSLAQRRIRQALTYTTSTPFRGLLTGTLVTALVHSSSAITVITIGLVNAELLSFMQALGIILGTNIGTCFTIQLIALNLDALSIPAIISGLILLFFKKNKKIRATAYALLGFGFLFLGIIVMTKGASYLQYSPSFLGLLIATSTHAVYGVFAGMITTALVQSSSIVTGVVLILATQGLIDLPAATTITLGSNIGTCITGVLASLGGNPAARQIAVAHVLLNIIGVLIFLPLINPFVYLISFTSSNLPQQIANVHLIFNIISSLVVLPFIKHFAKLVYLFTPRILS